MRTTPARRDSLSPRLLSIRDHWFRFVDRLLPARVRSSDPEELRRARLVITFWASVAMWVPPLAVLLPAVGAGSLVEPLLVSMVLGFITPLLMWRTGSVVVAGNYFTACMFGFTTYFALRSGGLRSPALLWQPVIVMAAVTLVGVRSAVAWTVIAALQVLVLLLVDSAGVSTARVTSAAGERAFLAIGLISVNLLVLFLMQLYESYKNAAVSALHAAQAETEQSRFHAEEASRAKSQFLANMSHEIRTPLNAVLGMTSLLLDTRLDATQHDYVETAHQSGEHLLTVINDILDFSKIEAGKLDLERMPFAIRECVEEAVDVLAHAAARKSLELSALIEPSVPQMVEGDPGRVRQVLVNLLSNAVKFTEAGEVSLCIEARPLPGGDHEIAFTVRDTGIGVADEHRELLFRVFSQVDASSTRRYGGTGLGLAISRRLVELMGGRIWFESEAGRGSTFGFTIRGRAFEVATDRVDRKAREVLVGKRLLIVDDNATNRRIFTAFAASWGMHPTDTPSPREALALLAAGEPFDVAVLDFQMPEMDGVELARRIRALPGKASFPLVLATSSLGRSARENTLAAPGFTAYLVKPVRRTQLLELLGQVIASAPGTVPATPESSSGEADVAGATAGAALDTECPPMRVLLVEDNAMNRKVALAMLGRLGLTADIAGDGREAIAKIAGQRYDVVLMDVQMPVMDGLAAARLICHRWKREERPRIVAMTANAMAGDEERCKQAGMDDYISKPVKLDELAAVLKRNSAAPQPSAAGAPAAM